MPADHVEQDFVLAAPRPAPGAPEAMPSQELLGVPLALTTYDGARDWIEVERDSFPTGHARRGWTVAVGHQHLTVTARPTLVGRDTAEVRYVESVATNQNGAAMGSNRDSLYRAALLVKTDAGWRVIHVGDTLSYARAP